MPFSVVPDTLFDRYDAITPAYLQERGIRLLLSDLDFTLATRQTLHPDGAVKAWLSALHAAGIEVMIVSNNRSGRRVTAFCAELGIPYEGHAGKPGGRGLRAAMARAGASAEETAMLGDKLLTDCLAANRCGVTALMVEPLGGAVTFGQKILHALQAPAKRTCRRRSGQK
ncbi:MAG: YqeG family HAD IIIA-type phosphatase [Oscillospiraceae bacterium]